MKNRFISLFLALAMVFVSLTPVMADDNYYSSPSQDGVHGIGTTTIGGQTIEVVNDRKFLEDTNYPYVVVSTVDAAQGYTKNIQDELNSKGLDKFLGDHGISPKEGLKLETVALFDVDANQKAKGLLKEDSSVGAIYVSNVAGVKKGDKVSALHFKSDGSYEPLDCEAVGDNQIFIDGLTSFSPILIVKEAANSSSTTTTTTTTDTSSTSTTKVVTCEDENGKGWVWSESKKACVYSVTNTSAK